VTGHALVRAGRLGAGGHELTEVDIGAIEVVTGRVAGRVLTSRTASGPPGDTFPELTLTVPGEQQIPVPRSFADEFGVVLFNRGAWCPYCTAQLRVPAGR
jgi:hypothetical protein